MPAFVNPGYATWDAGQGGGAVDVSDTIQFEDPLFTDQKTGVPFNPWGGKRLKELPGKIQASNITYLYEPADTSAQQYEDAIAAYDADTLQTFVIQRASGSPSTTIHQLTITFYESRNPAANLAAGQPVRAAGAGMIQSVVHYDGTTTYTWD